MKHSGILNLLAIASFAVVFAGSARAGETAYSAFGEGKGAPAPAVDKAGEPAGLELDITKDINDLEPDVPPLLDEPVAPPPPPPSVGEGGLLLGGEEPPARVVLRSVPAEALAEAVEEEGLEIAEPPAAAVVIDGEAIHLGGEDEPSVVIGGDPKDLPQPVAAPVPVRVVPAGTPSGAAVSGVAPATPLPSGSLYPRAVIKGGLPGAATKIADLNGRRIGVVDGSTDADVVRATLRGVKIVPFKNVAELLGGLYDYMIDAAVMDEPVALTRAAVNPLLVVLPERLRNEDYAFGFRFYLDDLLTGANKALAELKADGTIDKMTRRWLSADPSQRVMPEFKENLGYEKIRMGVAPFLEPFCYHDASKHPIGFEIELARRVADKMEKRIEFVEMNFSELVGAVQSGRVEMIGSCLAVTPERAAKIQFTDSYYRGGVSAVVLAR